MKSVNKVTLLGNVGKEPEVKYTPGGTGVANLTLATNERFKDKGGQWQDRTEWHNLVLWDRLAELAGEYIHKGTPLYIEGRLQTRKWEKDGQPRYTTEIVVSELVLLGGKTATAAAAAEAEPVEPLATPVNTKPISDDDIPF